MVVFKRGSGPLVSVIFPTRGRPDRLCEALGSIWGSAADPRQVEVCVRVDADDTPTLEAVKRYPQTKVIIGNRGKGYYDLHNYFNDLASAATGDWCLLFNDDAAIITKGWDKLLAQYQVNMPNRPVNEIFGLASYNPKRPRTNEFFFFRRKIYDILGHLSPIPAVDTHLSNILIAISAFWEIDIAIEHNNDSNTDRTFMEGAEARLWGCYIVVHPDTIHFRINDMIKLIDYKGEG